MEQLLRKVKERRDMTGVRMVAGAVRTRFQSQPEQVLSSLAGWTEHPDEFVRIAAGVSLGTVTVRNADVLSTVMPYVERLANDQNAQVRRLGAVGALELVWLYHYDELWLVIEDWIERKNDLVRRAAIETMGQIVKGAKINKPSILKQFIERGMAIIDRLLQKGSPELRGSLAQTVNEFGLKAGDLISPWVKEWASRSDLNSLSLARDILDLPFGSRCSGIDKDRILALVDDMESEMVRRVSGWLRQGKGRVEYFTIIVDKVLSYVNVKFLPFHHWADPYRGCQFRCEFCATRSLAEYAGDSGDELVRRVVVVANAAEVLGRELGSERWRDNPNKIVKIGMNCDPYQAAEEKFQVTREMLKVLLERENPVILQTRSETVLRDLDVLEKLAEKGLLNVFISLPTPIEGIRKKLELGVSSVNERMRSIAMLSKKGIPVGLVVSPIIPQLTDHREPLEELIRRGAEAGAAFVIPEVLTMRGSAGPKFKQFLESFIPALAEPYQELYASSRKGYYAEAEYVRRITEELVPELAAKHGANRTGLMLVGPRDAEEYLKRNF